MADPGRYTVLVVDDEPSILEALQRLLTGKFEVRLAQSGSEALAVLRAEPVDVIMADQNMPGMTGADLLAAAKGEQPEAGRLLLTGSADLAGLAAAVNVGEVQAYLTKPWERATLLGAVEKAAEKARLSRENRRLSQALESANAELTRRAAQLEAAVDELKTEVAARRQAEAAVRASEAQYRIVADNTYDWEFWLEPGGQFVYASPSCERITGYTPAEFLQDAGLLGQIVHPADRARFAAHFACAGPARQVGAPGELEFRILRRNGEQRWLGHVCQPVYDAAGQGLGTRGSIRDITARKQAEQDLAEHRQHLEGLVVSRTRDLKEANEQLKQEIAERRQMEEALRTSEARYRMYIDHSPEAMFITNAAGRYVDVNQAACRLVGYPREELIGLTVLDLVPSEDVAIAERQFKAVLTQSVFLGELRLRNKDGRSIPVILSAVTLPDGTVMAFCTDITELKRAEEEIRKLNLELESRIRERTAQLESEIAQRRRVDEKRTQLLDQLEQQAISRERELAALYEVTEAATVGGSLAAQLQQLLTTVRQISDSPAGAIHLLQRDGDAPAKWQLTVEQGFALREVVWLEAWAPDGPWKLVLRRQGITLIADLTQEFPEMPPELTAVRGAYLGLPIRVKDNWLGVLSLFRPAGQRFTAHETSLSAAFIDQLGLAVESILLRQRSEEAAVMEERERLARELHDSVTQLVYSLVLFAGAGREAAKVSDLAKLTYQLNRMDATALQALKEMRLLLYELRPAALQSAGLVRALQQRLDMVERRANVSAELTHTGQAEIPSTLQANLYQIAQEALNNALKHAGAQRVAIRIDVGVEAITLEVADNGAGFDLAEAAEGGGLGLEIMRERAQTLGGSLSIISSPGQGTRVTVILPIQTVS